MRAIVKQERDGHFPNRKGEKTMNVSKENILPAENEYKKLVEKKTPNSKKMKGPPAP